MVRAVADRAFLPAKSLFEQIGDICILTAKTVVSALRPPYPFGNEFIGQFLFAFQLRAELRSRGRCSGSPAP